jgi:uncharacterized membrane protein
MRRLRGDEGGVVAPLVTVIMLGLLAITALVIDGGVLFAGRRSLQALADGAARAGAMQLDLAALRGKDRVVLDPGDAEHAARRYLQAAGFEGEVTVNTDTLGVTVDLAESRATVLMGLVGVRTMRTEARAVARPRAGIERPEG